MVFKRKFRFSKKTVKRGPVKKRRVLKRVASFAKRVRRVVLKAAEPKHRNYNFGKTEYFHNAYVPHHINNSACMPIQGTGDSQRVGDQINLGGFMLRIMLGQKSDRPNVNWQWYVVKVPKGSSYAYNSWFENITNNVLLDPPNKDFVKVLKSGRYTHNISSLEVGETPKEKTYSKKIWIPYKKLLKFGPADAQTNHNDDDLYFILAAYDAYGTLLTDNIAYVQTTLSIYYKDP